MKMKKTLACLTLFTCFLEFHCFIPPPNLYLYFKIIQIHNNLRKNYQANPLKWSDNLAYNAQIWASKCVFEHSPYKWGENIAIGYTNFAPNLTYLWYQNEQCNYLKNPNAPFAETGHFTQMVSTSTTHLGCAISNCTYGIFDPVKNKVWNGATMLICEYEGDNTRAFINKPLIPPCY